MSYSTKYKQQRNQNTGLPHNDLLGKNIFYNTEIKLRQLSRYLKTKINLRELCKNQMWQMESFTRGGLNY